VWLCFSARSTADRILAIVPPIAAFVASGFEHSIANMFFVPMGLVVSEDASYVGSLASPPDTSGLTWGSFFLDNLLPVTIGNLIGGGVLVGALYWFVYLRPRRA
jgi:formate transporter